MDPAEGEVMTTPGDSSAQAVPAQAAQAEPTKRRLLASSSSVTKPPSRKGRPGSAMHSLFTIEAHSVSKETIGSKCVRCDVVVKDAKRSGALLARHIYKHCEQAEYQDRLLAWNSSKPLRNSEHEPEPPRPSARLVSGVLPDMSAAVSAAQKTPLATAGADLPSQVLPPTRSASEKPQMYLTNFADRSEPGLIDKVRALLIKFFVAQNIPFAVVESKEFSELIEALRPAFVSAGGMPTRKQMAGALLGNLFEEVKAKVDAFIKIFLNSGGKMTLLLDGWENVNHDHLVNFLVVIGEMALFLDSKMIGAVNQTAQNQAAMVQEVLAPHGGVDSFAAVATDNTQSCLNMRDIVCELNPGIVGLNDQAHVANLAFKEICALPFVAKGLEASAFISTYIRNHQYVNALYKICKTEFNTTLKQRGDTDIPTAINFSPTATTRFGYSLDGIEECVRNQKACVDLVFDRTQLQKATNANTAAKKEAVETFVGLVESRDSWHYMDIAIKVLTPLRVYLRLWDTDKVDITTILKETKALRANLEDVLEELCASRKIRDSDRLLALRTLDTRIDGAITAKVKVTLLTDIHYLAASVSPDTDPDCFAEIMPRALRAFGKFLVNSPGIFSEAELASSTAEERVATFQKELMVFVGGTAASILVGRAAVKGGCECLGGFWKIYGKEVGLLRKVGLWISYLSASSCPAERSFSAQKDTHTLQRNRLGSERVRMMTFCRWNLRLFSGLSPKVRDAIDDLINLVEEELDEDEDE